MQARKTQFERDLAAKEEAVKEKRRGMAKQLRDIEIQREEERNPKQAAVNGRKKLETKYKDLQSTRDINNKLKEDVLKQTEDQKMRMEVNMQARKTQVEKGLAAKEEVREEKRHGMAKQPMDIEIKLDEVREQKQAKKRTQLEEMEDELQRTEDQNK